MLFIKKSLFTTFFIIVAATGVALGLKAAVGVGAWDAFSQATSMVTGIKVGTFSMMMNISCVLVQVVVLKKDFKMISFLQIFMAVLLGFFVNIVFYEILANVTIDSYLINMAIYMGSLLVIIMAVALIMSINFLSFPLEAACMAIATKTRLKFGTIRQLVDVFAIIGALIIAISFQKPIPVREGTIIGMLLFGPLIAWFIPIFQPFVKKLGFVD
ncbi:MAG: hypothetical protein Q8S15_08150 [Erysipelotrichaceae bacterium]|nr:hypothetical protein [Erysipelotrichaceae bacterium]MDP3306030.1 hypothetical protein [Erysipelotrichaceae bacterium]